MNISQTSKTSSRGEIYYGEKKILSPKWERCSSSYRQKFAAGFFFEAMSRRLIKASLSVYATHCINRTLFLSPSPMTSQVSYWSILTLPPVSSDVAHGFKPIAYTLQNPSRLRAAWRRKVELKRWEIQPFKRKVT